MRSAVLIDTSYFIFHRFFATYRWYSLRNKDNDANQGKIVDNEAFMEAFYRHLENDIKTIKKKYKSDIWWMKDCPRCDIWRMQLYPEYKGMRKHAETFDGQIFPLTYTFLDTLGELYNMRFVSHPCLEADDLCYISQRYFLESGRYEKITILANDNDYLQIVSDTVDVINKEGKHIKERGSGCAARDMLKKILTGDKSDNIPSVCKGMGPKTADKIVSMSPEERETWIRGKGEDAWDKYIMNTRLIDFREIPDEYCVEVVENLKQI